MLFSWIVMPLNPLSTAIEMTAAGIEVAKVSPALSPKKTFAAVKTSVIRTPEDHPTDGQFALWLWRRCCRHRLPLRGIA